MTEASELKSSKGSVTYELSNESKGRFTATDYVDGFSSKDAKNNAAANALPSINRNAFFTLKSKRKGLIFQSIRKEKGLFLVSVQVDFVKYFAEGETQMIANNACSSKVLAAFESGDHERDAEALYNNAFNTLKDMYSSLLYQILGITDNKYECYVNVDGIDYFGEGRSIHEANNDTAWEALKSIWSGDHKRELDDMDDYWYDDDDYSSTNSAEYFVCKCDCHSCNCC